MQTLFKIRWSCQILPMMIFIIGIVFFSHFNVVSASENRNTKTGDKAMSATQIEEGLKEHTETLMSLPGVVGTGQGLCKGQPCIKVFVNRESTALDEKIQNILEGYPLVIEHTGTFRALQK